MKQVIKVHSISTFFPFKHIIVWSFPCTAREPTIIDVHADETVVEFLCMVRKYARLTKVKTKTIQYPFADTSQPLQWNPKSFDAITKVCVYIIPLSTIISTIVSTSYCRPPLIVLHQQYFLSPIEPSTLTTVTTTTRIHHLLLPL